MAEEDPQETTPEELDQVDDVSDIQEAQMDQLDASIPMQKPESSIYNLFWKVYRADNSTKVANLNKTEIGMLNISVRDALRLGMLGSIFHHPTFGMFFMNLAEITNSTSMARDGWFTELFVSQKKFQTRARKASAQAKEGWKIFQKKQQQPQSIEGQ